MVPYLTLDPYTHLEHVQSDYCQHLFNSVHLNLSTEVKTCLTVARCSFIQCNKMLKPDFVVPFFFL